MKNILKNIAGWLASILIAFLIVFFMKTFIGMPTTVKGMSMVPAFFPEEKLWLSTFYVNTHKIPERGTIITFEAPSVDYISNVDPTNPIAIYNNDEKTLGEKILYYGLGITKKSYIKRVIGVPGDHVEIKDGKVFINGEELVEDYISEAVQTDMSLGGNCDDIIVPDGYVYVLGDNRIASSDSRRFGCIPIDKIEGKVYCIWWPIKNFKII
jgi:signal peptidase I